MTKMRDLYKAHLSEHDAAQDALTFLKVREPAFSMLLPLVIRDVQLARRIEVRGVEASVGRTPKGETEATTSPMLRAALLAQVFAVGDGRLVRWGEATVEDHEARIDFLTKQIRGTQLTIGRHAESIELITQHNVKCLDDIAASAKEVAA